MEKYGVEEKPADGSKTASEDSKCPECDKPVEKHGSVTLCPDHGSEPFEKKEELKEPKAQ